MVASQWLMGYARVRDAILCLHGLKSDKKVTLGRGLSVQPSGIHATAGRSQFKSGYVWTAVVFGLTQGVLDPFYLQWASFEDLWREGGVLRIVC